MKTLQIAMLSVFLALPLAAQDPPVTITIEIPADIAAKLEELRTTGQYPTTDGTGNPLYASLEALVRGEFRRVWLGPLLERFPTAAMEQHLATIRTERKAIDDLKGVTRTR